MVPLTEWLLFLAAAVVIVLTPGPTMAYLVSRSVCQGRRAGAVSVLGVVAGATVHMLAAAVGLSALLLAVPLAYEAIKWAGAIYLLWLAWKTLRAGSGSLFKPQALPPESSRRLFVMGFVTNLLNPKLAMFYLAVLPQFASPEHGSMFVQNLVLGLTQVTVSLTLNLGVAVSAASVAAWFAGNSRWVGVQRYLLGFVFAALAVRLALEPRR